MKRIITALLMAVSFLATSCTDDSKSIVGTWFAAEMTLVIDGKTIDTFAMSDYNWEMTYLFYEDGKGAIIESIGGETAMNEFTWVLNGSNLTINNGGESISLPFSLSRNELSIQVDQEIDGKTYKATIYFYR